MIRKACLEDMSAITAIYEKARQFMARHGNPTQWGDGYPAEELLRQDILASHLYVEEQDAAIHGVFAFILGEDATYRVIEEGAWLDATPYGTIHRVAGDGEYPGLFHRCVAFCAGVQPHLRVDTHKDNTVMQGAVTKEGFVHCGTIYVADGSPRLAYERPAGEESRV